jgi:subfamily B ATP-binding cassette protein MsbA
MGLPIGIMEETYAIRRKLRGLYRVAMYRPGHALAIVFLSIVAAALEGIGLGFLVPIVETVQAGGSVGDAGGVIQLFERIYATLGIPFTLGFLVAGVMGVMTVRYTLSFFVAWLRAGLRAQYITALRVTALERALDARIGYFDEEGSDEILNTIITEAKYAGRTINTIVELIKQTFLALVYLGVAFYFAPRLTAGGIVLFGSLVVLSRLFIESGYSVGERVARANERIQRAAQEGTQGIGAVKLFGLKQQVLSRFRDASQQFTSAKTKVDRNKAAIANGYRLAASVAMFLLIYVAFVIANLSLAAMSAFLFAMFRFIPMVNGINRTVYNLEQGLPHLIRVQEFIDDIQREHEPKDGSRTPPKPIENVTFDDVSFSYDSTEQVLSNVSFEFTTDEFVAFVGPSGAGKSTIASLLCRLYEPESGRITANGVPINEIDLSDWREQVSIVRQQPHIFNTTLAENVAIGQADASRSDIEWACELSRVTEFVDELPCGYDTELGDDGVRLSGGQRQRVAIARALLKDADLLILDEATSDLDSSLEQQVHDAIQGSERDRALLVIAHRLSTVTDADRIYTVEDGKITQTGSHSELLEADGQYASLYRMQVG